MHFFRKYWPYMALFIVNLIYAANYLIAKGLMPDVLPPNTFIFLRVFGALILFLPLKWMVKEKVARKDIALMAACAFFGSALNMLTFFNGLVHTSALNASIIMTLNPILVAIMGGVILKEKFNWSRKLGIVIGTIGAVLFILMNNNGDIQLNVEGDFMILINASSYALYLVLAKPLMQKYHPFTIMFWVFLFGSFYCSIFTINEWQNIHFSSFTASNWQSIAFVILGTTFLTYLLNLSAMKKVSPTVVAAFIYLQPLLVSVILLFLFLFTAEAHYIQSFNALKIFAAFLIFVGVYLTSVRKKKGN